jgi:hypothetical protein
MKRVTREEFESDFEMDSVISDRKYSTVWLYSNAQGVKVAFKETVPNSVVVTADLLEQSYVNYSKLENKLGLVQMHDSWRKGGKVYKIMEFLSGYEPVSRFQGLPVSNDIFVSMMMVVSTMVSQGYVDYGVDVTNFVYNRELRDLKLIDLDKVMPLTQVCEDQSHYGSWFASRLCRIMQWSKGTFDPNEVLTKLKRTKKDGK